MSRRPPRSTLFPYTALFRSKSTASSQEKTAYEIIWTGRGALRSEEHTSELQSHDNLVCRLLLEKKDSNAEIAGDGETGTRAAPRLPPVRAGRPGASLAYCCARGPRYRLSGGRLLFFFNDTATTEIYTLSLHDALPIWVRVLDDLGLRIAGFLDHQVAVMSLRSEEHTSELQSHDNLVCRLLLEKKK